MKLPLTSRLLAVVAALAIVATGCTGKDAVAPGTNGNFRFVGGTALGKTYPAGKRKPAGDFTANLLNGGKLTLSQEEAGKVTVINFWATWCGPCTTETPQFDSVYRAYKAKGVTFIGIDTKDNRDQAKSFVKNNDISYPIVFDEQGQTALQLGGIPAIALPFTVIIDKHGKVAVVYLNSMTPKDLEPLLNSLIAET